MIQEIATGQGKSLIAALQAAYLSFTGQTVDIVTSSSYLAKEALENFSGFYDSLGISHSKQVITTSSNISEYKKGGINIALVSDMALFRANREFHKDTMDLALNTDVSVIFDEADHALTSEVNYKLAVPLINTTQEETRELFSYILDYSETEVFMKDGISSVDDVENLKLYLAHQFNKYALPYPLKETNIAELKISKDPQAIKLYLLHLALVKCKNDLDAILSKFLDNIPDTKLLKLGIDYVLPKQISNQDEILLKAIPIIKDQASKGTVFGNGVQTFLHLLIEREHPEWKGKLDMSPPSCTIFNISPKNFFDYYRLTGGKMIGLTGTAGNALELQEFRIINKMLSFEIPRFEKDLKIIKLEEAVNAKEQYQKMLSILNNAGPNRPILIFAESTKEAEQIINQLSKLKTSIQLSKLKTSIQLNTKSAHDTNIVEHIFNQLSKLKTNTQLHDTNIIEQTFNQLSRLKTGIQLYAESPHDTNIVENIVNDAGNVGKIVVTTPMLGRGTDFFTSNKDQGFLAINLCTNIVYRTLKQIEGRVARNGNPGEIVHIFNKEFFAGIDIASHMSNISNQEKEMRMKLQPLSDVLKYFNKVNQDSEINAIDTNEFIVTAWKDLLKKNPQLIKDSLSAREALVKIVVERYPETTKDIFQYLKLIQGTTPSIDASTNLSDDAKHYEADYVVQDYKPKENNLIEDNVQFLARSTSWHDFSIYKNSLISYNKLYKDQSVIMATHVFTLEENKFQVYDLYNYDSFKCVISFDPLYSVGTSLKNLNDGNELISFFLQDKKIYCKYPNKKPLEITEDYTREKGIPKALYKKILTTLQPKADPTDFLELQAEEKEIINEFLINAKYIDSHFIKGEGSSGNLMLDEFKRSFAAYKKFANSVEVNKISNIIENYGNIKDIDTKKLEYGKYQAINISTKFDSDASHAESIITDGKFLFWINRGGGSEGESGIKLFKVIHNIEKVKTVLNELKVTHSQADTRKKIYTLLREESDLNIPKHTLISMKAQKIGNCGWTQTKGMLKVAALVGKLNALNDLPDETSQEWQKALKDSHDIYKDFTTYDRITRAEAFLFMHDQNFVPQFLDLEEKNKIEDHRTFMEQPVSYELLKNLADKLDSTGARYENTIYEKQYHIILDLLKLETALGSSAGKALQRLDGKEFAGELLASYKDNTANNFSQLNSIDSYIKNSKINDPYTQDELLKDIINCIIKTEYSIINVDSFLELLTASTQECINNNYSKTCVINHIHKDIMEIIGLEENYPHLH